MSFRVQGMSNLRAHDALLDALLVSFGEDQPLHEDPGCVHMVGIDRPRGEPFLDFGDRHAARCRHHRIEIARGLAVDRSAEHTSELQSPMRISYAVLCLTKKTHN